MRFQGRITDWRNEKGFGFITPDGGGQAVFFHIKCLPRSSRRPAQEDRVNYTIERDERGRLRAANVDYVVRPRAPSSGRGAKRALLALAAVFVLLVATLVASGMLPLFVGIIYAVASVITFCLYALDKSAAKAGRWRTAESTLHMFGLLGGWPGGLVAQQLFRHKSKKTSFIFVFWFSVAANISGLLWLMSSAGREFIGRFVSGNG